MKRSAAQASSGHSPCPETGRGGDRGTRRKVVDKEEEGKEEEEEKHVGVCPAKAISLFPVNVDQALTPPRPPN